MYYSLPIIYNNTCMKSINVPAIGGVGELAALAPHAIDVVRWPMPGNAPETHFRIGYDKDYLYILYDVAEADPLRTKKADFENVWEDSCVEFFCEAPQGRYFNFEFNANGVGTFSSRRARNVDRRSLDGTAVLEIGRQVAINDANWQLLVTIPWKLLEIKPEKGRKIRANFYKCGDKTAYPHFLMWNEIDCEKPDFHRPECFGELVLA